MKRFPLFRALSILLVMLVASAAPGQLLAQQNSHTTTLGNHEIVWGQSWTMAGVTDDDPSVGELVLLENEALSARVGLGFVAPGPDIEVIRDAVLEGAGNGDVEFSTLETGSYENVAYQVDTANMNDAQVGMFTLVIDQSATGGNVAITLLLAPVDQFSEAVASVQAETTVDGAAALNGIDPAGMQSFLDLAQATSGTARPADAQVTESVPPAPAPSSSQATGGTYTDPVWGYTVNYGPEWQEFPEGEVGDVTLAMVSPMAIFGVLGLENPGAPPAVLYDALRPTFESTLGPNGQFVTGVIHDNGVVFLGVTSEGLMLAQEILLVSPTTAVIVTVVGDNEAAVIAAVQGITINGIPLLSGL